MPKHLQSAMRAALSALDVSTISTRRHFSLTSCKNYHLCLYKPRKQYRFCLCPGATALHRAAQQLLHTLPPIARAGHWRDSAQQKAQGTRAHTQRDMRPVTAAETPATTPVPHFSLFCTTFLPIFAFYKIVYHVQPA